VNAGELDSLLERAGELPGFDALPADSAELKRWAERACTLLVELRQALRDGVASQGGTLALRLRAALESQILLQLNGRAELTTEVSEHSLGVHVLEDAVFVDVRLRVGKVKNAKP
jgi:hypothetical protein